MIKKFNIGEQDLTVEIINKIIQCNQEISLSKKAKDRIIDCRNFLDNKLSKLNNPIYGVNTGFGSLCDKKIKETDLQKLQTNLVLSHACGMGEEVPLDIVKIMLILKIHTLALGFSGVQLTTVQRLIDMYNNKIIPVVFQQGSLGASGDLAPLAHLVCPLLGEGQVYVFSKKDSKYYKKQSCDVLHQMQWSTIKLKSKEGLALLNGTQFMSAYMTYCLIKSKKISYISDLVSSISIDAFDASLEPFNKSIHKLRPFKGQMETCAIISENLKESNIQKRHKQYVQDPYSFRCIPQVHGATKDVIRYVQEICNVEINSVTDNPIIIKEEELVLSGGNFHGQPLAMSMDYLAIAISELGSISERRIFQLISGSRNLPAFLVTNSGVNSGFMIPQYTAASIVSENKQLCTPSSVDSIVSSNGQEDHVSMGANAARKLLKVLENLESIIAIELMTSSQAIQFRNLKSSIKIENLLEKYRSKVTFLEGDRFLHKDLKSSIKFIQDLRI
ncbi:MAG: histidine ammonia-lyase [Flavobacteriales bacterium]|nr:histidine ammonia-lyase [Flavobacteriales bacterium]